jgi:hypothetical protein
MFCDQRYGDWPIAADAEPFAKPDFMLLSYNKPAAVSSGTGADKITKYEAARISDGASIRVSQDENGNVQAGIRFQSVIDKSVVDHIDSISNGNYTIGTIIAPLDYINGAFTMEALGEGRYLNIPATEKGMHLSKDEKSYLINAAMINILPQNYGRDFAAIAYITYKDANGETVTLYSGWNSTKNVRSAKDIAYAALADVEILGQLDKDGQVIKVMVKDMNGNEVELTEENAYELGFNKVTSWYELNTETNKYELKEGVAYTVYSAKQRNAMLTYIGASVNA